MSEQTGRFIILKKTKYSESDLIIHALSHLGAKKSFIARGALKSKKRFGGGVLEPTHFVQMSYKESKQEAGLSVLSEAQLIDDFSSIRTDYDKLEFALTMLNCVSMVSQEGDVRSDFLYNLLGHSLRFLKNQENINLKIFKTHFYLKFLFQQGVVSLEPWMSVFLKINISDSLQLHQDENVKLIVSEYADQVEAQVLTYIRTADL